MASQNNQEDTDVQCHNLKKFWAMVLGGSLTVSGGIGYNLTQNTAKELSNSPQANVVDKLATEAANERHTRIESDHQLDSRIRILEYQVAQLLAASNTTKRPNQ